jgi:hypothetical protein
MHTMRTTTFIVLLTAASAAFAHDPGLSSIVLRPEGTRLTATLRVNRVDLGLIGADHVDTLRSLAPAALEVSLDGHAVAPTGSDVTFEDGHALVRLDYPAAGARELSLRSHWMERLAFGHKQFVRLESAGGEVLAERLLGADAPQFEATLSVPSAPAGAPGFFRLGVEHILSGWDHLLFLATVLVVCGTLADALRTVSAFTLAHSLTLALATLGWVRLPASLVEPAIAGSIVIAAVLNLAGGVGVRERFGLTFAFGLVHGLGFAGALADLDVGTSLWSVLRSLLAFNGGVEAGQLAVASLLLPMLWSLARSPAYARVGARACSAAAALVGLVWFVERTVL